MNVENIKKAIAIMKRARYVDMTNWQTSESNVKVTTEAELHACGNSACFAGHIAVSPEFKADGGSVDGYGRPIVPIPGTSVGIVIAGEHAIAHWLGIELKLAELFVYGQYLEEDGEPLFYDKPWSKVNATDVIKKLEWLLRRDAQSIRGDAQDGGE